MKYYEQKGRFTNEISRQEFYSRARRKGARKSMCVNDGRIVAWTLKYAELV